MNHHHTTSKFLGLGLAALSMSTGCLTSSLVPPSTPPQMVVVKPEPVEPVAEPVFEPVVEPVFERTGLWWSTRCAVPGQESEAPATGLTTLLGTDVSAYEDDVITWLSRETLAGAMKRAFRAHGYPNRRPEYELRVQPNGTIDRVVITTCSGTPALDMALGALLVQEQLPAWQNSLAPLYLQLVVRDAGEFSVTTFERQPLDHI
jgi:hypothetical protein